MDVKIDGLGVLFLKRRGEWVVQWCPYGDNRPCGDHCPQLYIEDDEAFVTLGCVSGDWPSMDIVEDERK